MVVKMKDLSMFDLSNKKAIVTGGGSGLGRGIALGLAQAGADVAIVDINEENGRGVAEEIDKIGSNSLFSYCDVSSKKSVTEMANNVKQNFKSIDILVNSAGIVIAGPAEELSEEDWRKLLDVQLSGTFFCCQAIGKIMIEQKKGGKIINIASMTGSIVNKDIGPFVAYCAAKAGVKHLTKALAIEWAKYKIYVNSISPGYFETPMSKPFMAIKEVLDTQIETTPLKRIGQPEELQGAAIYLASDASSFVTGHDLLVDGGHTVW